MKFNQRQWKRLELLIREGSRMGETSWQNTAFTECHWLEVLNYHVSLEFQWRVFFSPLLGNTTKNVFTYLKKENNWIHLGLIFRLIGTNNLENNIPTFCFWRYSHGIGPINSPNHGNLSGKFSPQIYHRHYKSTSHSNRQQTYEIWVLSQTHTSFSVRVKTLPIFRHLLLYVFFNKHISVIVVTGIALFALIADWSRKNEGDSARRVAGLLIGRGKKR